MAQIAHAVVDTSTVKCESQLNNWQVISHHFCFFPSLTQTRNSLDFFFLFAFATRFTRCYRHRKHSLHFNGVAEFDDGI